MRVLVTGANGFVGRVLCEHLEHTGHQVVPSVKRVYGMPGEKVVGELDGETRWNEAIQGCEAVVHLAARVHVLRERSSNPLAKFRAVNVDGSANLARRAAAAGVKRFVYLSTAKVHGESTENDKPFSADDPPAPTDPYSISKWEAEQALWKIAKDNSMELVIIRPPLVYGPGVKANFLEIMATLRRGIPMPFASVTSNRRSLVNLDNLVDLIATCLVHPKAINQTFLVSDGEHLSTADLLFRLNNALGRPAHLFHVPVAILKLGAIIVNRPDLYQRLCSSLCLDISKTNRLLDWKPPITVDEGLRRTFEAHLLATRR